MHRQVAQSAILVRILLPRNVRLFYGKDNDGVKLILSNRGSREVEVSILDKYTGKTRRVEVGLGQSVLNMKLRATSQTEKTALTPGSCPSSFQYSSW